MLILIPFCYGKHLSSVRYGSYAGVFASTYLVFTVIICYFYPIESAPPRGQVHWVRFSPQILSTLPLQIFGYSCAQNIFNISNELIDNSQQRINTVVTISLGGAFIAYQAVSVFGYLTFGSNVGSNIIAMYPSTSFLIAIGQLAIITTVAFGFPLVLHPCRQMVGDSIASFLKPRKAYISIVDDEPSTEPQEIHGIPPHREMSSVMDITLTSGILVCAFWAAYFIDNLEMVLSFVGSTGMAVMNFILPGLFFWHLFHDDTATSRSKLYGAVGLSIFGVFVLVFCLSYNVYRLFRGSNP